MRAGNPNFGKAIAGLSVGILLSFLAIHGACADTIQPKTGAAPTNDTQPQPFAHPWRVAQNLLNGDDSLLKPGTTPAPAPASPAPNAPAGGGDLLNGGGLLQGAPANGQVFTGKPAAPAAAPAAQGEQAEPAKKSADGDTAHGELFAKSVYPSAIECSECHPKQFREWAVSSHAYAQLSPIFNAFQRTVNVAFNGSNGDFCFRCHTQVGTALSESPNIPNQQRSEVSREGITCISCHRIDETYNKISGRLFIEKGPITSQVFGPTDNKELKRVLSDSKDYQVSSDPDKPGRKVHGDIKHFAPIRSSTFCGSCHDVTLFNGFRLEEAFSEYRTSPAAANGTTCQDCHMGKVQGRPDGYEFGPAAMIEGVPTRDRRITSHLFSGPDYSIVHPGFFPHNKAAQELATISEWTQFDYKAGWGTDAFEKNLPKDYKFPDRWRSVDDRYDARAIIETQLKLLDYQNQKRLEILRNGYQIGEVVKSDASTSGLSFKVEVKNGTDGHNIPTGFTEERLVWLDTTVTDPSGKVVFHSGDRDPYGDVRDRHSSYVRAGEVPIDDQLFNLQATVLVRNLRGSEQPAVIPIPFPNTALPYVRPATNSAVLTGQPTLVRNQKRNIDPLGHRWAEYSVDGSALTGKGTYKVSVVLRSQMVPVNLVLASQGVGFDYGMSTKAVVDALVEGSQILEKRDFTIDVN